MTEKFSVIIYTNQKKIGNKIGDYLEGTPFLITGISSGLEETKTHLTHHAPDFLIINLTQPCSNPRIHPLKITSPRTRIVITEEKCNSAKIYHLIQAGADSFLPIPFFRDDLITVLTNLARDEIFLPSFVAKAILEESHDISQTSHEYPFILTERERFILGCLSKGMQLGGIEAFLEIDTNLIKAHLTNILQKIHFSEIVNTHFNDRLGEVESEI